MFCRNCGKELTGSPESCINCGGKPMAGTSFCPECGAPTTPLTEICAKCGVRIAGELAGDISPKSRLTTTLLAFFPGVFGAHRFYIGKTTTAIVMLFLSIAGLATLVLATLGLTTTLPLNIKWFFVGVSFVAAVGIWAFVDFIFAVIGRMKDNEGRLIQKWSLVVPAWRISRKSRLTTALLAFFLGIFGAHRFYVGKTERASLMLFLGIFGLVTILATITIWPFNIEWFFVGVSFMTAVGIWAFVDFVFAVSGSMQDNEGRFIQRWWLAVPAREPEYYFIKYATSVLRVLGWAVLVIGIIASLFFGLQIMNDGLMVGGTELMGVGMGVSVMILGIIGSFLAWLFVLVNRELVYLFLHVKDNTKNTAGHIAE